MLEEDVVKKYIRAGEIARIVREEAARRARPSMSLLELAEWVENRIRELGGEPAFPVNISINDVAAHYTPVAGDELVIPDNSVVKIDIGVHVDGYIADTAVTVSFSPVYEPLLEASKEALAKALSVVARGVRACDVGRVIEETVRSYGFKPIRNLTGHSIDRYLIHSGYSIPNYNDRFMRWRFSDGVYAIEPFATDGAGYVKEGSVATIFALRKVKGRLTPVEKRIVEMIWNTRRTLPFCERWIIGSVKSVEGARNILKSLSRKGILHVYPVLIEKAGGFVSQFEHTILINGNELVVTTG